MTTKRSHKKKQQVAGYWSHNQYGVNYYVKPYKRAVVTAKRRKLLKRARETAKRLENPLRPGWVRYEGEGPEERIVYTYKAEILVLGTYKYPAMMFQPGEMTSAEKEDASVLQYWHSKFEPTIKKATVDFLEKVPLIRAFGDVHFLSIDLYRVSGVGRLKDKNWKLLASFDKPEDIK